MPPEWGRHAGTWLAWPAARELWLEALPEAQRELVGLCRSIALGERLRVLVTDEAACDEAAAALIGLPVDFHRIPYGDIWLRDIAPLFLKNARGELGSVRFRFNGWGGKYVLPHDEDVARRITEAAAVKGFSSKLVLEGGAVEVDGAGTCLTTRQCLQNVNRNPGLSEQELERQLGEALGVRRVVWLDEGLQNDHTDGHIDTLARFVREGVVVCMEPSDNDDPNDRVLREIARALGKAKDAEGRALRVVTVPSPGRVRSRAGELMPASYMNFYIANRTVIVPTYGARHDDDAVRIIAGLFEDRRTVGMSAKTILEGGGAFHCITQQEPRT